METATILQNEINMYKANYDFESPYNISDLNNKLFCTFTTLEGLEGLVKSLSSKYSIMYNKMFALYIKSNDEYVLTYNVDQGNGGVVNTKFPINWKHYRNCILLTQHNELKQLNTKIHKIIEL